MSAGQKSGTGAMVELDDKKVRKNDILSNRDKAQRQSGQSLDSKGIQVEEYKDIPTNRRSKINEPSADTKIRKPADTAGAPQSIDASKQVDRPGFDLGGATGKNQAGRGLGLGTSAKEDRKGQRLPRGVK